LTEATKGETGLGKVATPNKVIVVYPQAEVCWDTYGYTDANMAATPLTTEWKGKQGIQPKFFK